MTTPAITPVTTPPIVAHPVNNNPTPPSDAKTSTFFEKHKPYLLAWVGLVGAVLLWKGKVAAAAVGAISAALYTVYCKFIDGRAQQPAPPVK